MREPKHTRIQVWNTAGMISWFTVGQSVKRQTNMVNWIALGFGQTKQAIWRRYPGLEEIVMSIFTIFDFL